ncbi:hypothetical protein WJX72_008557 [[Myrmecia] bisecta]|uniref:Origin recognition complex subunit 3 n=1 Tax=[Myrmecia] bisecta TaxID=41462 RepID=A0AAW1PER6_9CHLO
MAPQWVGTTEEQDDEEVQNRAFNVIREMPIQLTERAQKTTLVKPKSQKRPTSEEVLLRAFRCLVPGEPEMCRRRRLEAGTSCWKKLSAHIQQVLESTNQRTFEELCDFAFANHTNAAIRADSGVFLRQRVIPTALTFAGGINSAEHARTFPALVTCLREQGCYAGLLSVRDFRPGCSVSGSLNSLLRQFSGQDTHEDDTLALAEWYADKLAGSATDLDSPDKRPAGDILMSPLARLGLATPKPRARKSAQGKGPAAADEITSPVRRMRLMSPDKAAGKRPAAADGDVMTAPANHQQLTSPDKAAEQGKRPTPTNGVALTLPVKQAQHRSIDKASADEAGPSHPSPDKADKIALSVDRRPLVVVVEGAEGADPLALQRFIQVMAEGHADLPVILILGMATSAEALQQMLSSDACEMLRTQHFQLTNSMEGLDAVFREVLLGPTFHGVFFGHDLMAFLNKLFLMHNYSVSTLQRGLQVACMGHFRTQPLGYLAAAATDGDELHELCSELPEALQRHAKSAVKMSRSSPQKRKASGRDGDIGAGVEQAVQETCATWSRWAVTLRWLSTAAVAAKYKRLSSKYALNELYQAASHPHYMKDGMTDVQLVCDRLERFSLESCRELLQAFQEQAQQGHVQAAKAAGASQTAAMAQATAGGQRQRRLADKLADLLLQTAKAHLTSPPCTSPGAAIMCCNDPDNEVAALTAAPRHSAHIALAAPHTYLGGAATMGASPEMEDICIAYWQFQEYGELVNVADWFASFCTVYGQRAAGDERDAGRKTPAKSRRGPRGSKKVMQDADEPEKESPGTSKGRKRGKHGAAAAASATGAAPDPELMEQLAARFSQASAEMQVLGLLRPARKRRGDFAQKVVFSDHKSDLLEAA